MMSIALRVALVAVASTVLTANAMAKKVHYKPFTADEKAWFDRASQLGNGGDGGSGGGGDSGGGS